MWSLSGRIPPPRRKGKSISGVHVKDDEPLEDMLKHFKCSYAELDVLAGARERGHYESPNAKHRKRSETTRKNHKKYY